jgi:hypothetical protein
MCGVLLVKKRENFRADAKIFEPYMRVHDNRKESQKRIAMSSKNSQIH